MNTLIKQIIESKFNFNINIDPENNYEKTLSKSSFNSKSQKLMYEEQYIVDLGLPSGTKWCKYNLGVNIDKLNSAKDWYGNYYAWGELEPKSTYNWETYKFKKELTKYNKEDKLILIQLEDDAAYLNMHNGIKFKIPTEEQFDELLKHTMNTLFDNYQDIKDLNGWVFISKMNRNELFIPAAGSCYSSDVYGVDSEAYLWSSNSLIGKQENAWRLKFGWNENIEMDNISRCYGLSIRPVLFE